MNRRWCLVTGGAGFVGSRLIRALADGGFDRVVLVDSFSRRAGKLTALSQSAIADFLDYFDVDTLDIDDLDRRLPPLDVIFHMGAWTDVLETDATRMLRYNFEHSRKWIELGQLRGVPVIYASTSALYGRSSACRVGDRDCERPLNAYGYSKLLIDRWIDRHLDSWKWPVVALRFFNVFGPGEEHKAHNASIPTRFFRFLMERGTIDLFHDDIRRDYVHADDVARVLIQTWQTGQTSGIYNLGSGVALSHREIADGAVRVAREVGLQLGPQPIRMVSMPKDLRPRFQFYTCASEVLPWIGQITERPMEKMLRYWIDLAQP